MIIKNIQKLIMLFLFIGVSFFFQADFVYCEEIVEKVSENDTNYNNNILIYIFLYLLGSIAFSVVIYYIFIAGGSSGSGGIQGNTTVTTEMYQQAVETLNYYRELCQILERSSETHIQELTQRISVLEQELNTYSNTHCINCETSRLSLQHVLALYNAARDFIESQRYVISPEDFIRFLSETRPDE